MKRIKTSMVSSFITKYFFYFLFLSIPYISTAQEKTQKEKFQNDFESFKKSIQNEFNVFKSSNDSIFQKFLDDSWKEFELFIDKKNDKPKPKLQPKIDTTKSIAVNKIASIIKPLVIETSDAHEVKIIHPSNIKLLNSLQKVPLKEIIFYGTKLDIPYFASTLPILNSNSKSGISSYFDQAANSEDLYLSICNINEKSNELKLNGWGSLKLIQAIATEFYEDANSQVLFTWFTLMKIGYKVKVAYVDNDFFLLCDFDSPLYNNMYCEIKSEKYYIVLFRNQYKPSKSFFTYEGEHIAQIQNLQLKLKDLPDLESDITQKTISYKTQYFEIEMNKNLIDFYKSYPNCDISVYLSTQISPQLLAGLDKIFKPRLEGKSDLQKLNILLNFVQYGIKYQIDEVQFGKENYLFAEEALYYPYADCEDRVALLTQLLKHFTKLDCIGLDYPGHLSMAVKISNASIGDYLNYNNEKYFFCDPTYIGAGIGMQMSDFRNIEPVIINTN